MELRLQCEQWGEDINIDEFLFSLAYLSLTCYCAVRLLTGHRSVPLARGLGTLILSIVLAVKLTLNKALGAIYSC